MEIIPAARTVRYEQLEPGEIFLFAEGRTYALKARPQGDGDRNKMVLLGPSFLNGQGSSLVGWQATTVLSFGKNCTIFLPTDPNAWAREPVDQSQVWLAVADDRIFVCTNGAAVPQLYFPCFVDVQTGEIVEGRIQGFALYTNVWEIAVLGANHPPHTILKYPLQEIE